MNRNSTYPDLNNEWQLYGNNGLEDYRHSTTQRHNRQATLSSTGHLFSNAQNPHDNRRLNRPSNMAGDFDVATDLRLPGINKQRRDKTLSYPLYKNDHTFSHGILPFPQFHTDRSYLGDRQFIYNHETNWIQEHPYNRSPAIDPFRSTGVDVSEAKRKSYVGSSESGHQNGNCAERAENEDKEDGIRKSRSTLPRMNQRENRVRQMNKFCSHKTLRSHSNCVVSPGNGKDDDMNRALENASTLDGKSTLPCRPTNVDADRFDHLGPISGTSYNTLTPSLYLQPMRARDEDNRQPRFVASRAADCLLKSRSHIKACSDNQSLIPLSIGVPDQLDDVTNHTDMQFQQDAIRYGKREYMNPQICKVAVTLMDDCVDTVMRDTTCRLEDIDAAVNLAFKLDGLELEQAASNNESRLRLLKATTTDAKSNKIRTIFKYPSLQSIDRDGAFTEHLQRDVSHQSIRRAQGSQGLKRAGVQRIFCVRHGERVDVVFGNKWVTNAFDQRGMYHRVNLNMPTAIPSRANALYAYQLDCPLTEIGSFQARLTGEAMRRQAITIDQCYSSPALRSVQTAHNILQGLGSNKTVTIKIEPGLFEYLGWYDRGIPQFISPQELKQLGYNIDLEYIPYMRQTDFHQKENYLDFYNRSHKSVLHALETSKLNAFNVLLCGHAATLEVCTRQLCGRPPRSYQEFNSVIRKVGYLGLNACERTPFENIWRMKEPPIPPLQYAGASSFDWKLLL